MKTPLGTEVDVGPGHTVLDGDPAPPRKGHSIPRPVFSAHAYCGHGGPSQLLLSSCWNFNGRNAQKSQTVSPCQISSKSLKPRPKNDDFLFFQKSRRRHLGFL